jgi:hypothetical protein
MGVRYERADLMDAHAGDTEMTTHLILHKVRGEPAFDIAEPTKIGNEDGWIIPTSGHRAYPYWNTPLCQKDGVGFGFFGDSMPPMPENWPDHYQEVDRPVAKKGNGLNVMDFITIPQPKINLVRRRL